MRRRKLRNGSKGNGVHPATMEKRRRRRSKRKPLKRYLRKDRLHQRAALRRLLDQQEERS